MEPAPASLAAAPESARRLCMPSIGAFFLVALADRLVLQVPKEPTSLSISDTGELVNGSLRLEMIATPVYGETVTSRRVFGILGIVRLSLCRHLVAVTDRELCGTVSGKSVWKATAVETFPIPVASTTGSAEQVKAHDAHLANLKLFLRDALFYFSYDFSLTLSQQLLEALPQESATAYQWEHSEERFFWNMSIAVPFCRAGFGRYVVAAIDGFFQSHVVSMQKSALRLTLISRRSRHRGGTRFLTRGVDPSGNVANFVETEQILELVDQGVLYSWVTVRGSIPVFWSQLGTERIPRPVVHHTIFSADAFRRHMSQLRETYGSGLTLINLIDQSGKEAHLGDAYEMAVRLYSGADIRYVSVDFHELTKGDRYDNLSQLMEVLADDITAELWFSRTAVGRTSKQRAVARVNCVDCLDRTNVVQAMLGKFVLHHQLYLNRLMDPGTALPADFLADFNSMWTDNADAISLRYTGASAMKTNFTRTGVHGLRGQLQDGVTAAERFVGQMLRDPAKQDAINLFVGKYCSRRIGGLGPNAAADGIVRVKAYKKSTWKAGAEYPVAFEINKRDVLIFDWDNQKVRVFPIESLRYLNASVEEGAVLTLGFDGCVNAKMLRFQNPVVRQKMMARILQLAPHVPAAAREGAKLSVFVGSVNMMDCGAMRDMSTWITPGCDIYVVSCANAIFKSPDEFVFFGAQYFFYQVLSLLGPALYECCDTTESATGDGTLIVCRKELRGRLSAIEVQAVTRTVKPNDPSFLKRVAYASAAHREVARSKSQARVDALGSANMRTPRRRGTVDIQKEVAQIGFTFSFSVDDGPLLHFAHLWDGATAVPNTHKYDRVMAMGQFLAGEKDGETMCVTQGETNEEGKIVAVLTAGSRGDITDLTGKAVRVDCDGSQVDIGKSDTEAAPKSPTTSRPSSQLEEEAVVADMEPGVGSADTLSKIQASLQAEEGPQLKAGVVRVNSAVAVAAAATLPSRAVTALAASFSLHTLPLLRAVVEPAGSVLWELRDVKVAEWTGKWPPTKLRLEFNAVVLNDEPFLTPLCENGVWANKILLSPWTVEHLQGKTIAVSLSGFAASTSSFGGFLSTITGTASILAVGRVPLNALGCEGGAFRVPMFAVNQEVLSNVVYGWLSGSILQVQK